MAKTPEISVLICTRNRADSLRETLASLAVCEVPPSELSAEFVVIDNRSTDDTRDVVAKAAKLSRAVPIRYLFAGIGGQASARNVGLAGSAGRAILFTDDDVRVPANYLPGMAGPILSGEADMVCGGVRLASQLLRDWMTPMHRSWLASTESIDPVQGHLVGANMAFSRHVLDRVPRFDERLGPGAMGFRDDTLFAQQLHDAGFRYLDNRSVEVEHHFSPNRLTRDSFIDAASKHGRSTAYFVRRYQGFRRRWPRLRQWRHFLCSSMYYLSHLPSTQVPGEKELRLRMANAFWAEYLSGEENLDPIGDRREATSC